MFPTKRFEKKQILVGITGGIAAYKVCELIRYLVTQGAVVRAMMTENATRFITELTIETLSRNPVYREMFPPSGIFYATHHIEVADRTQAAILVPATANIIGKIANGIADDFVSTTTLALHCPVVIAPAMNENMWRHPATRENMDRLQQWNYLICEPEEGFLAEGYSGVGRLARLESLIQYLYRALHPRPDSLAGKTVLITAGRTEEYLDPVRMLTNRSTGRMGFALAWEAFARGARVILVHGPGDLPRPARVETHAVVSAEEMYAAVSANIDRADIFISAAAIADYRPVAFSEQKIKKNAVRFAIETEQTRDVLREMSRRKQSHQRFVGFAVETRQPETNARKKLKSKKLDMIVLNNPLVKGAAFAGDTNVVTLIRPERKKSLELQYKLDVAFEIFQFLLEEDEADA